VFQVCWFINEIVDSVYSRRDLLQLLDHSVLDSSMSSFYDNSSLCCDNPVHSGARTHVATADQRGSQSVSCDTSDLMSRNDGSPSVLCLPNHMAAYTSTQPDTESQSDTATLGSQQSSLHNAVGALHHSSISDFVSQLNVLLAPLSDFLTQHLAMLQTWLSCTSYRQLVASLCRHIAQVYCFN